MTLTRETYVDLQKKYEKVKKLIEVDSKLDPANDPYLSKYNAKQLLIGMKTNIENLLCSQSPESKERFKLTAMLGAILLYLGKVSMETEEVSTGEKHLTKCLEIIASYEKDPEMILIALNLLNEVGFFWLERKLENSKQYLEKAEELYNQFKNSGATPIDIQYLFQVNPELDSELCFNNLEKVHTLTLYYLAQLYGVLEDHLRSAIYCHITLKRQLQTDDYNLIEWALNAATLSQFFMEKNGFKQARHHLAASSYVLEIYENQINQSTDHNEEYESKMENFKHRSADIARCWAKYGLLLLSSSRERLIQQTEDTDHSCSTSTDLLEIELPEDSKVTKENLKNLTFTTLNITAHENQITDQFVLVLEDARKVFLNIKTWLDRALTYYTLLNLASDHIEIVLDQSQMYLNLSFFEDNPENQAKMHKRRIDLMEEVLKEINPTFYMRYCRQLWYELAQVYIDILYIKLDKLKESEKRPIASTLAKINNFVDKGILYNFSFINSFKKDEELPDNISEDYVTPFLKAYLSTGALYSRYIAFNKKVILQNTKSSLECYQKVRDYCEKNPKVQELLPIEYGLCTEMITLLPTKILKLEQEVLLNE